MDPKRAAAHAATAQAYNNTPTPNEQDVSAKENALQARLTSAEHAAACILWGVEAQQATDETDRAFCEFLADSHERQAEEWQDEAREWETDAE